VEQGKRVTKRRANLRQLQRRLDDWGVTQETCPIETPIYNQDYYCNRTQLNPSAETPPSDPLHPIYSLQNLATRAATVNRHGMPELPALPDFSQLQLHQSNRAGEHQTYQSPTSRGLQGNTLSTRLAQQLREPKPSTSTSGQTNRDSQSPCTPLMRQHTNAAGS
jgi:hypothetical protein